VDYKGVGVVFVREQVRALDDERQSAFRAALTPEQLACFEETVATQWVPIEHATACFEALAAVAYSDADDPLLDVGKALAHHDLRGVYRYLVRVATIRFLISQTARLWSTYHRHGEAVMQDLGERHVRLRVTGYVKLPQRFRHCSTGWIHRAMEICGARTIDIREDDARPPWDWVIRWT